MKNIWKLDRDGNLAHYYRYFYLTDRLPNNGCSYFWKLCMSFILLPFVWPIVLINRLNHGITLKYTQRYDKGSEKMVPYTYYSLSHTMTHTFFGIFLNAGLFIIGALFILFLGKINPNIMEFANGYTGIKCLTLIYVAGIIGSIVGLFAIFRIIDLLVWFDDLSFTFKKSKYDMTDAEYIEYEKKIKEKEDKRKAKEEYRKTHPNFFKLIVMRFKSYKEKECPMIEWQETHIKR